MYLYDFDKLKATIFVLLRVDNLHIFIVLLESKTEFVIVA